MQNTLFYRKNLNSDIQYFVIFKRMVSSIREARKVIYFQISECVNLFSPWFMLDVKIRVTRSRLGCTRLGLAIFLFLSTVMGSGQCSSMNINLDTERFYAEESEVFRGTAVNLSKKLL